jgi:hypothetical protein
LTRRDVIRMTLGVPLTIAASPAWAFATKEFWDSKPAAEWSPDEIKELTTKSPWAREAIVSYNGGPGGALAGRGGGTVAGGYGGGGRMRGGRTTGGLPPSATIGSGEGFKAVARWESALPVREAINPRAPGPELPEFYVIALIGDLPSMGRQVSPSGDDQEEEIQYERRLEMLRQYTKLEKKGDPIFLAKAESTPAKSAFGSGTLFYFPRTDSILPDDKQVTFVTKIGPYEAKAKFSIRDMLYRGKLAL